MKPGLFNVQINDISGPDSDFDTELQIQNGIFETNLLVFSVKIGTYEIKIDKRQFVPNYDNIITIRLRLRGPPGSKDNAIYIHTTDYL